ncbi:hypothetical protein [Paludibacter sp.]|uniref:hypothetical protein n=1 Tax=Paludibacter sp. TaxID=1898105 RepID=UPI0013541AD9|nr:hypothetical protein [Paludibacter sp.]MTK53331.1 hypothetical protein [Paludibacter sp.]
MEFNKIVIDRFKQIFHKNDLRIIEQFSNYVKIESDDIVLIVSHDKRENSNSFYIGKKNSSLYPIDENILRTVFNSALKIDHVTPNVFVNNLALFLDGEGYPLIIGDISILDAVEKYILNKSNKYTAELRNNQNLDAANKAWKEGDYESFIKHIDTTDRQKLPSSYELKYKMAQQKLKYRNKGLGRQGW